MTIYALKIKADLENIEQLIPKAHNLWKFNISSGGEGGEMRNGITISDDETTELANARNSANFVVKWSDTNKQSYANIVKLPKCDGTYKKADSGKFVAILGLECRGLEPLAWIPSIDFDVGVLGNDGESVSVLDSVECDLCNSNEISNQDLQRILNNVSGCNVPINGGLDWVEYDEMHNESISILNFEWKIEKV